MYVLADGDKVTVVDCGVWRPDLPDGGLASMEAGLEGAGYALADVSQGHRHARAHRSLRAGRPGHGTDRRRPVDACHDGPGLREVPAPGHRAGPAPGHLRRPRHPRGRTRRPGRPPHPVDALPALRGGGLHPAARRGAARRSVGTVGKSSTPRGIPSATSACIRPARRCCSPATICCPGITPPVTFERGFDADPMRSYLHSLEPIRDRRPELVYPGHGRPFGDAVSRIQAIMRNKVAPAGPDPQGDPGRAVHGRGADRSAGRRRAAGPPAAARDQRDAGAHRLPAVVGTDRAADPSGRRLRVVQHQRRAAGRRRRDRLADLPRGAEPRQATPTQQETASSRPDAAMAGA